MAYKLMIQGTMSSAGKSFIVTGLCRLFSDLGYKVAPFKSQNMALNSGVTFDGLEMGRAQIVQAEAGRTVPDVRMNPVLLKPNSDIGSQVIVMGKPIGNMKAREYYEYKKTLVPVIKDAFHSLENDYDVIIVEGAGSPAEINLKENDIVNMGIAKMFNIPVLLVGDIDLGGVFAQLLGTLEWLDNEEKDIIKGFIINKFRGDVTLLKSGIDMLTERTGKKVIGVVPYSKAQIDEEDSVTVDLSRPKIIMQDTNTELSLRIIVIRLPHMSNFTDFTPLERVSNVNLKYVNVVPDECPDLIIIPGTKSTIKDLNWMKENGIAEYISRVADTIPVIGICGGYQILGNTVSDPFHIEAEDKCEIGGLGLINQTTVIKEEKTLTRISGIVDCTTGFFSYLNEKEYEGYEIHAGITEREEDGDKSNCLFGSGTNGNVLGTYVHGFFDKASVTKALIAALLDKKYNNCLDEKEEILSSICDYSETKDQEYNVAADTIRNSIDINMLMDIMGMK